MLEFVRYDLPWDPVTEAFFVTVCVFNLKFFFSTKPVQLFTESTASLAVWGTLLAMR
jgi:hypothetical protein